MDVRAGLWRKLRSEELMILNCVLEKTLESPLDCKEIQPVHPKGDQSWVFIGMTDAEAETPILWPPHAKSWLIGKDSDAGRDWGQEEREMTRMTWLDGITDWMHMSWVNSRSWRWTGRPGMLRFMGSQRVGHDWETELNWTNWIRNIDGQTGIILLAIRDPWWKTRVVCDIMKNTSGLRLQLLAQSFKNLCNYLSNRNLFVMLMR